MSLSATDQFQPFCWPPQLYYKIIVLICGPENGYLIQQYFWEKKLCASPLSLRKYDLSHKCAQGLPGKRGEGKGSSQCHPSIINQYIWSTLRHHHPSSSICMPMPDRCLSECILRILFHMSIANLVYMYTLWGSKTCMCVIRHQPQYSQIRTCTVCFILSGVSRCMALRHGQRCSRAWAAAWLAHVQTF